MKPRDPEELARDAILDPEPKDTVPQPRRQRAQRLQPLPGPYVRVPLQWILKPHKPSVFGCDVRLFLYLLYASHWGQRGVRMTDAIARELAMSPREKRRGVARLVETGWVRVKAEGSSHVQIVTPLVHSG